MAEARGTAVVLFTRDLRVYDNPALASAVRDFDRVLPLFVLDEHLLAGRCGTPNRIAFLRDCLSDLDSALRRRGGRLVLRRGDPVREALELARSVDASAIHLSADASAYAHARERGLAEACAQQGIELRLFAGVCVVEPGSIAPLAGDHYRVFTPYWRAWRQAPRRALERAPRRVRPPAGVGVGRLPALSRLVSGDCSPQLARGGESVGRTLLARWLRRDLAGYPNAHDDLAADATSRLSPHLHFGCVSAAELEERALRRGGEELVRQLCWRDFYHQVLAAAPALADVDYRPRARRWRRDERFAQAWRQGRTGMPIVDAGMRQLASEGFIHNRARMIVASYLVKTAGLDWRVGARHFEALLLDCDLACNSGNWQWVAGTGNDTRPNRVLNPLRQARRFDPDGEYVRRYVPELARVPGGAVHEPWALEARVRRALDYPDLLLRGAGGAPAR